MSDTESGAFLFVLALVALIVVSRIIAIIISAVIFILQIMAAVVGFVAFHLLIAWLITSFVRGRPMLKLALKHGQERNIVRFWLLFLPLSLVIGWFVLISLLTLSTPLTILMMFSGAALLLFFYRQFYIDNQPKSMEWPYFVQTANLMRHERRVASIEYTASIKTWWMRLRGRALR